MSPFDRAIAFVLSFEGGYSNDPKDPGGETRHGISKRAYPHLDIANLTKDDAIEIYRKDYWLTCHCDKLPSPIAVMVMDIAVNQGTSTAAYLLQEAVNVKPDGIIGTVTISAALNANLKDAMTKLFAARCQRYATAKNVHVFGKGWFRRAAACLMAALEPL
jgi:lysozyme family protein